MAEPNPNFVKNVGKMYRFCSEHNNFSSLILKSKDSELLACPVLLEEEPIYHILFFPDLEDVKKFSTFNISQLDDLKTLLQGCEDHDIKYTIYTIFIMGSDPRNKDVQMMIYSDLNKGDEEVFEAHIVDVMNKNGLKFEYLNEGGQPSFGLPADKVTDLVTNAVLVYPNIKQREVFQRFTSPTTGKTEFFSPVNIDTAENDDLMAAYLIFPNAKSVDKFFRQSLEHKDVYTDALLVKIYFNGDYMELKTTPLGEVEHYDEQKQDQLVRDLLIRLETMHNDGVVN